MLRFLLQYTFVLPDLLILCTNVHTHAHHFTHVNPSEPLSSFVHDDYKIRQFYFLRQSYFFG